MFEVGKKVICIKDHKKANVKRGQVFELQQIRLAKCKCKDMLFDIGLSIPNGYNKDAQDCYACGATGLPTNGTLWLKSTRFAPYDDSLSELTAEEILNEVEVHA